MGLPNILYIHSHDTGRYVQPYGYAVPTPNFQCLAEDGVLFRQAFCASPTCSPSRAALLTGQCAHSAGMFGLAHLGWRLNDYRQHLVNVLKAAGYRATLIGFQHEIDWSQQDKLGYDEIRAVKGNAPEKARCAEEFFSLPPATPFFLSVGFTETHRFKKGFVHTGEPRSDWRYCRPPTPIPDLPETRRDMAGFMDSAWELDEGIGRVLAALGGSGLAQDTIVICTTDHGLAFQRMKCNLYDHGTGVMLMIRGPGFPAGKVVDAQVSQVDIFPTLCECLGIEPPPWLQGSSLLPLVRGEKDEIHEAIFSEVNYHAAYEPMRAVRTRRWKYIRRFPDYGKPVVVNCDANPSREVWLAHGWREQSLPAEELYDLIFDPNENCNLAGSPLHQSIREELRERLRDWMTRTEDPLLEGPIAPVKGARYWPQTALDLTEPQCQAE